jgi:hypothetical protein
MGILGRFRNDGLTEPNTSMNPVDRSEWVHWGEPVNVVVGEDYCQDTFVELFGEPRDEGYLQLVPVTFVREPDNEYDTSALRAQLGEYLVGYLRREQAEVAAAALDAAGVTEFTVAGLVRGGDRRWNSGVFSVQIWPDRLMTRGPVVDVDTTRDKWAKVRWPPFAKEGRPGFDVECSSCMSSQIHEWRDGLYYCERCGAFTAGS